MFSTLCDGASGGRGAHTGSSGQWYFKARTGKDPLTGKWTQVTRRGFASAGEAQRARRQLLDESERAAASPSSPEVDPAITIRALVTAYLDEAHALGRLSAKTHFDYQTYAESYIYPYLGDRLANEVSPSLVTHWQVKLAECGARKTGRGLSANTIRLARAPLNAAFKYGLRNGIVSSNPVADSPPPPKAKSIPAHWTPEQANHFLATHEGDRLWPLRCRARETFAYPLRRYG